MEPGLDTTIDNLRVRFSVLSVMISHDVPSNTRYVAHTKEGKSGVALEELILKRRSVRIFDSTPVDRKMLEAAIALCVNAPSACNRLPYRFVVLDERRIIDLVGALAAGTGGWLNNIPCLLVVVGDWSNFADVADRNTPFIDSAYAVIQLLLKLEKDSMGGCVINWKNNTENDRNIRGLLSLQDWEQVISLVAIGEPLSREVPLSIKKDVKSVISWNT